MRSFDLILFRRKGKIFKLIPVGGSGDFNVDFKDVRVSVMVILRQNRGQLEMEHFDGGQFYILLGRQTILSSIIVSVDIGWRDISFKFDGFLTGLGELADKIMNQLGVEN